MLGVIGPGDGGRSPGHRRDLAEGGPGHGAPRAGGHRAVGVVGVSRRRLQRAARRHCHRMRAIGAGRVVRVKPDVRFRGDVADVVIGDRFRDAAEPSSSASGDRQAITALVQHS